MKTYIAILIGIVALSGIVYGGMRYMKKSAPKDIPVVSNTMYKTLTGTVSRFYEGTSTLRYSFDVQDAATHTIDMDGALVKVINGTATLASMYMSYEGGRGYTAADYIADIVAPHVSIIAMTGTSTYGAYEWVTAETAGSNWYIASVANGEWLVVVEGKKSLDLDIKHMLETMNVTKE